MPKLYKYPVTVVTVCQDRRNGGVIALGKRRPRKDGSIDKMCQPFDTKVTMTKTEKGLLVAQRFSRQDPRR